MAQYLIPDNPGRFAVVGDTKGGFSVANKTTGKKHICIACNSLDEALELCDRLNRGDHDGSVEVPDRSNRVPLRRARPEPKTAMVGAGRRPRVMYIEQKTAGNRLLFDRGPAMIVEVTFSKTGTTIYAQGKSFQRIRGGGVGGNYRCLQSGDTYWITGVKSAEVTAIGPEAAQLSIWARANGELYFVVAGGIGASVGDYWNNGP